MLAQIARALSTEEMQEQFVPLVDRLSSHEWFTGKVSSCSLFACAFPQASPSQKETLKKRYLLLARDPMPLVKKAALVEIGQFASCVDTAFVKSELLYEFCSVAQNE